MSTIEILGIASMVLVAWFTWRKVKVTTAADGQRSPREAIVEAWVNIIIGYSINFAANLVLLPMMTTGGHVSASGTIWGGWVFTVISMLRQYWIARNSVRINAFAVRVASAIFSCRLANFLLRRKPAGDRIR